MILMRVQQFHFSVDDSLFGTATGHKTMLYFKGLAACIAGIIGDIATVPIGQSEQHRLTVTQFRAQMAVDQSADFT